MNRQARAGICEEMTRQYRRILEDVWEDGLLPQGGLTPAPPANAREWAILEVLRSIPEDDYRRLAETADFWWFIPDWWSHGWIEAFPATVSPDQDEQLSPRVPHAKVLYLSPRLERAAPNIVVGTVAHELAHVVLRHRMRTTPEEYEAQEKAVFARLCEWGYEREAKKLRALNKWRTSWIQYVNRKLREEHSLD